MAPSRERTGNILAQRATSSQPAGGEISVSPRGDVLGRGLVNAEPKPALDESEAVRRELVVARCNPPTFLGLVEDPLDQITRAMEVRAETDRLVRSTRKLRQCQ